MLDCKSGSTSLEEITKYFVGQQDRLFDIITLHSIIDNIKLFLNHIIQFDVNLNIDTVAIYLGSNHSHLVGFLKGCSQMSINLDSLSTEVLLKIVGIGI